MVPQGIDAFEILAIGVAGGVGLKLWYDWFRRRARRREWYDAVRVAARTAKDAYEATVREYTLEYDTVADLMRAKRRFETLEASSLDVDEDVTDGLETERIRLDVLLSHVNYPDVVRPSSPKDLDVTDEEDREILDLFEGVCKRAEELECDAALAKRRESITPWD